MSTKQIWDTYSQDIRRFILSKTKDETATDDILQDTFIKVHTKLHTLKNDDKLKSWLFSVARYTLMDYFRAQKIKFEFEDFDVEDTSITHQHTEKDCLRGILVNLPKKYREPIFLADIMGLKQKEVAQRLHLPLPTVKSQIQRGRQKIAEGFMDCCGFEMNEQGYLVGELQDKEDCKICH